MNWLDTRKLIPLLLRTKGIVAHVLFVLVQMIDDQDLGFIANFLGIFIFALVIAYHYVTADPKYEAAWVMKF